MAKRITVLTDEQRARFPEWVAKWTSIGLRTGPSDRSAFERHVARCYHAAGLEPPRRVIWVPSPWALAIRAPTEAFVLGMAKRLVAAQVRAQVGAQVHAQVGAQVDAQVGAQVRDQVAAQVRDQVHAHVVDQVAAQVGDQVHAQVHAQVRDQVDAQVAAQVRDQVHAHVVDQVDAQVRAQVAAQVRDQVDAQVRDQVRAQVRDQVHAQVDAQVAAQVRAQVAAQVRDQVAAQVGDQVHAQVGDQVHAQVGDQVHALMCGLYKAIAGGWSKYLGGQFWGGWGWAWGSPSYVSFFREVCGLDLGEEMTALAVAYAGTAASACWWWPHHDFVMVCERPAWIDRDEAGRLHSETRRAIEWPDGWGLYRIHGVDVPEDVVLSPETLTVARIDGEKNAEVRRIMIERFGLKRYVRDAGAHVVHEDEEGSGAGEYNPRRPRRLLRRAMGDGLPDMMLLDLINASPEPPGTKGGEYWMLRGRAYKRYMMTVDAQLRPMPKDAPYGKPQELTCHNAVASMWGLRGAEYAPEMET